MKSGISTSSFQCEPCAGTNWSSGRAAPVVSWDDTEAALLRLGVSCFRTSLEWARIQPLKDGPYNRLVINEYLRRFRRLKAHGIGVTVCLFHFTVPLWFEDEGGFESGPDVFVRYALDMIRVFRGVAEAFLTMNEPNVYAFCGYLIGRWPPKKNCLIAFTRTADNLIRAHKSIFEGAAGARVGLVLNIMPPIDEDAPLNRICSWFWNHYFLSSFADKDMAFLGINYYFAHDASVADVWKAVVAGDKDHFRDDLTTLSTLGWPVVPEGLSSAVRMARGRLPRTEIWITENGISTHDRGYEAYRFLLEHVREARRFPFVTRFYVWTLFDCFEWDHGTDGAHFGLFRVGRDGRLVPKSSVPLLTGLFQKKTGI